MSYARIDHTFKLNAESAERKTLAKAQAQNDTAVIPQHENAVWNYPAELSESTSTLLDFLNLYLNPTKNEFESFKWAINDNNQLLFITPRHGINYRHYKELYDEGWEDMLSQPVSTYIHKIFRELLLIAGMPRFHIEKGCVVTPNYDWLKIEDGQGRLFWFIKNIKLNERVMRWLPNSPLAQRARVHIYNELNEPPFNLPPELVAICRSYVVPPDWQYWIEYYTKNPVDIGPNESAYMAKKANLESFERDSAVRQPHPTRLIDAPKTPRSRGLSEPLLEKSPPMAALQDPSSANEPKSFAKLAANAGKSVGCWAALCCCFQKATSPNSPSPVSNVLRR